MCNSLRASTIRNFSHVISFPASLLDLLGIVTSEALLSNAKIKTFYYVCIQRPSQWYISWTLKK